MELLKVITHAQGGFGYIKSGAHYGSNENCVMCRGYGINPYNASFAEIQFKQTALFWNNQNKNPFLHCMISFSTESAHTADEAMRFTDEIIAPLTEEHFALSGAHDDKRTGGSYHTHSFISTTNFNDGSMLYADNSTTYALAQRAADVIGKPVKLVVKNETKEWECPKVFVPREEEEDYNA